MILDAGKYRRCIEAISQLTKDKTAKEQLEMIGKLSVITGVPIIVVAYYMGELYGFSADLDSMIDRLKKFYTIKEVINIKR